MDVFGLGLKIQEEGAATVTAAIKRLGAELAATVVTIGGVAGAMNKFIDETSAAQFANAKLAATLRATNGISGQTAAGLKDQAAALQDVTVFSDDAVVEMQTLLLTMQNIRGVIFTQAVPVITDLATVLGRDLSSAAMMVGKALESPTEGLAGLAKVGVRFSDEQKKVLEELVNTGKIAEAQAIILDRLKSSLEGNAVAAGRTLGGALARLSNAFGELFEAQNTTGLVSAIDTAIAVVKKLGDNLDKVKAIATSLGGVVAGIFAGTMLTKITTYIATLRSVQTVYTTLTAQTLAYKLGMIGLAGAVDTAAISFRALLTAMGPIGITLAAASTAYAAIEYFTGKSDAEIERADAEEEAASQAALAAIRAERQARADAAAEAQRLAREAAEAARQRIRDIIDYQAMLPPQQRDTRLLVAIERELRAEYNRTNLSITRRKELFEMLESLQAMSHQLVMKPMFEYEMALELGNRSLEEMVFYQDELELSLQHANLAIKEQTDRLNELARVKFAIAREREAQAERDRNLGNLSQFEATPTPMRGEVDGPTPEDLARHRLDTYYQEVRAYASRMGISMRDALAQDLATSIQDGLENGLQRGLADALASGKIKDFMTSFAQTLRQVLSQAIARYLIAGLKSLWDAFGKQMVANLSTQMAAYAKVSITFGKFVEAIKRFLMFGNGFGAIIAATALLAFAHANGGRSGGGGGGGNEPMGQWGMSGPIVFGPTSATTAAGMTPRANNTFNIIGPNDPNAQRQIQELITKADSRGRVGA